jgi:hypothetical protein
MNFINWNKPPEDPTGLSMRDLQKMYRIVFQQLLECKRMKSAESSTATHYRRSANEAKQEAKKAKGAIVTLTKKQKAKEEASKAGYWSGGAAICVALFYELCKASDAWIGGAKYQEFWQHEAMISTLTFLMTSIFGWVYKCAHPDSK